MATAGSYPEPDTVTVSPAGSRPVVFDTDNVGAASARAGVAVSAPATTRRRLRRTASAALPRLNDSALTL